MPGAPLERGLAPEPPELIASDARHALVVVETREVVRRRDARSFQRIRLASR